MTRFIAFSPLSYDTIAMRFVMTLLIIAALALLSGRADAAIRDMPAGKASPQVELEFWSPNDNASPTQSDGMTLSQAVEWVRRRTNGEVVGAETRVQGGREVHYIRVLKDGKVKTHRVNGRRS